MNTIHRKLIQTACLLISCLALTQCGTGPIGSITNANTSASEIARESRAALNQLYNTNPKARQLGAKAKGILVFPEIIKGGFMLGGMGGNGALVRDDGSIQDFYQTGGLSYGFQAGLQEYGYALFLMNQEAFENLNATGGWEVGSSPSLVVINEGMAGSLSTATLTSDAYAVFFNQRGLMGGLGLQGSKITRIHPQN